MMESVGAREATPETMAQLQRDLDESRFEGSAAGGLVTATVQAPGRILDLRIDPSLMVTTNANELANLVMAAIASGVAEAESMLRGQLMSLGFEV